MSPDREVVLAAIKECVTVVRPGEVLAVRLDTDSVEAEDIDMLNEQAREVSDQFGVSILFVPGEEFARLVPAKEGEA